MASTSDLVREALGEARELVRIEVALAKAEVKHEIRDAEGAAIGFGVAGLLGLVALTLFAVAIVLAFGGTAVAALVVGACFVLAAGIASLVGFALVPEKPLAHTLEEARRDVEEVERHVE